MLPINFNISDVDVSRSLVDVKINLKDEYQHLVYTKKVLPHQVPISYVGIPQPTHRDIEIIDENETSAGVLTLENSFRGRVPRYFEGRNFTLPTRSALITDVFYQDDRGTRTPLFFKHEIEDGFEVLPDVLDGDLQPVDTSHFKVVVSEGTAYVFHDLEPEINYENLRAQVYYIRYTNGLGERKFKLLESYSAYKLATLEEGFNPLLRRYTVRDIGTAFDFRITFNHPGPFFVKIEIGDQIKLRKPLLIRSNEPWNLSVTDGDVYAMSNSGFSERYNLPEYHLQNFAPIEPIRFSGTQECLVLSDHLVKTPVNNLSHEVGEYLEVLITDDTLSPKYAWSTRSDIEDFWVDRLDGFREQGDIVRFPFGDLFAQGVSVDRSAGLIYIPVLLGATDRVFIRTHYKSKELKYLELNLNPLHNSQMQTGRAVVYVIPESDVGDDLRGLYHLILDRDSNIVSWNDYRLGDDELDEALVGDGDGSGWQKFQELYPSNLVLGSVSIVRNISVDDITFIDVRERGGGLSPSTRANIVELTKTYPELQWFDFPDRQMALPLQGAMVVELPFELLEEGGGDHTRESVERTFRKHTAVGQMPIFQFTTQVPEIKFLKFDSEEGTLTVKWRGISRTSQYQLNLGITIDQPLASVDIFDQTLEDGIYTGTVTDINGMDLTDFVLGATHLFVSVSPLVLSEIWPSSKINSLDLEIQSDTNYNSLSLIVVASPSSSQSIGMIVVEG